MFSVYFVVLVPENLSANGFSNKTTFGLQSDISVVFHSCAFWKLRETVVLSIPFSLFVSSSHSMILCE